MSTNDEIKIEVLNAARALFVSEGLAGLTVRKVAESAGTTTMAVYSRFGGKEGLLTALFEEGFDRLYQAQLQVPASLAPAARVQALCQSYRQVAQTYPHHYALMLGQFSGAFEPPPHSRLKAVNTLEVLAAAVQACNPQQSSEQARSRAHQLFAFCHGWVSLEDKGLWGEESESRAQYTQGVADLLKGMQLL